MQDIEHKVQAMEIKLAGVDTQFTAVKDSLIRIEATLVKMDSELTNKYVTKDEFCLVRNIVFGMVTIILVSVVGALIANVVINPRDHIEHETVRTQTN